jgi:dihydrofolate reductase
MSKQRQIKHIVGVDKNWCIGNGPELLFHIGEDLKHFKRTTLGNAIIMGRKTFESFARPGKKPRPLPGRPNIIITRDKSYTAEGCTVVHSIEQALEAVDTEIAFFIGGGEIYNQTMDLCDELIISHIDAEGEGDIFYPNPKNHGFMVAEEKFPQLDSKSGITFQVKSWRKAA